MTWGIKMEQIFVVAVKSFVNGIAGSVTRKQRLLLPKNIASEFVAMGLVQYENQPAKKQQSVTDVGKVTQSASLPAETASPTLTLPKSGRGKRGK